MTTTNHDRQDEFSRQAEEPSAGLLTELWDLLRYNKKWWLAPILIAVLLGSLLVILSGTALAPFIYTLF